MDYPDSNGDDASFVVLGHGSIPPNLMEKLNDYSDNSNVDSSVSSDVQQRLDQLLRENQSLKDALDQTNIAMKAQFETLAQWQREVHETHKTHKEKFAETRELVLKLRSENTALKKELKEVTQQKMNVTKDLDTPAPTNTSDEVNEVTTHLKIERLIAENLNLAKERDAFRECLLKLKISDVGNINNKSKELVQPIENNGSSSQLHKSYDNRDLNTCGQTLSPDNETSWLRIDTVDTPEHNVTSKTSKMESLLVEETTRQSSEGCDGRQCEFQKLYEKQEEKLQSYERTVKELETVKKDLTLKGGLLQSVLSELTEEREKIRELELQCEEVAVLKAQVEVYQSDYQEEREAREKLATEKEKLAEEVRLLKARLVELESQVSGVEENRRAVSDDIPQSSTTIQAEGASSGSDLRETSATSNRPYQCPVCNFRFLLINECETHINECLDKLMP